MKENFIYFIYVIKYKAKSPRMIFSNRFRDSK